MPTLTCLTRLILQPEHEARFTMPGSSFPGQLKLAWQRAPLSMFMATVGGVGHLPGGPGTYAAILTIPVIWGLHGVLPLWARWTIVALLSLIGCVWCDRAEAALNEPDSRKIVWDEVMGVWLALVWCASPRWPELLVGLVAFRVFDMWKPWPVKPVEHRFDGGTAIMVDDLVAGVMSWPFVFLTTWLLNRP